ncbi:UDP-3-O-acyl-N-acetylglucosamine deacetylase [Kamptonema animale CS-326]|jgi:UDP-3-O-[3-hydroxymyristoyl] N-acetylglucosamine deacetylase|uniref:UDP-3-O-acyl-N-acetylglucosamine deacetylase n=1 Tax=Kamptonema animale TaxID=92934 RepID=UPI002330FDE9|nr:UDP-3-O-acyl-N-acetylglucosamine deacetylase [Kamptonema animale]MDB9514861.1 UDP-3-O-acyl-N-acetylglucosamine deacetylase [Kamptonema animale CS-326]
MSVDKQYTLADEFQISGIGLHSGVQVSVRVLPAIADTGRYFVRIDTPGFLVIPACIEAVSQTTLSTELSNGKVAVRTVEHLLAALTAMGVDNARIEIDGPELPLLDGSAKNWVEAIASVGLVPVNESGSREPAKMGEDEIPKTEISSQLTVNSQQLTVNSPLWVHQGDAFAAALPAPETRFSYGIDFDSPAIGNQWYSWSPEVESFAEAIAPARTFALAHQIDQLRQAGLIKGGSLDNALVCDGTGWINPPLRFPNEPVRHKILDLVGDLSLLGTLPQAHYLAYKASHNLHIQLAKAIGSQP